MGPTHETSICHGMLHVDEHLTYSLTDAAHLAYRTTCANVVDNNANTDSAVCCKAFLCRRHVSVTRQHGQVQKQVSRRTTRQSRFKGVNHKIHSRYLLFEIIWKDGKAVDTISKPWSLSNLHAVFTSVASYVGLKSPFKHQPHRNSIASLMAQLEKSAQSMQICCSTFCTCYMHQAINLASLNGHCLAQMRPVSFPCSRMLWQSTLETTEQQHLQCRYQVFCQVHVFMLRMLLSCAVSANACIDCQLTS